MIIPYLCGYLFPLELRVDSLFASISTTYHGAWHRVGTQWTCCMDDCVRQLLVCTTTSQPRQHSHYRPEGWQVEKLHFLTHNRAIADHSLLCVISGLQENWLHKIKEDWHFKNSYGKAVCKAKNFFFFSMFEQLDCHRIFQSDFLVIYINLT